MSGKRPARKEPGARPGAAPTTPPTNSSPDDLLLPSGRVDRGAVFRAARAQQAAGDPPDAPAPIIDDDGLGDDDDALPPVAPGAPADDAPLQPQRVVFTLARDLDKRLDKYLTDRISFMSRAKLQALIESGGVTVNGKPAKPSTNLRLNDVVEVHIQPPPAEDVPPQDIPLEVLFEDEHLVVLNKSPDIIVHPARSHLSGTLINALAYHFRHRSASGGDLSGVGREFARPGVVHRLDRQTSGVIVFAKTDQAHWQLANQFMQRTVDKRYIALVHGEVTPLVDVIDEPLGPHPSREKGHREKQVVRHDHLGKPAVSVYRVLGTYDLGGHARRADSSGARASQPAPGAGWSAQPGTPAPLPRLSTRSASVSRDSSRISLVEVELKTGRTHQIRVHLMHRGYPLVADDLYGGRPLALPTGERIDRVALHAARLTFRHPISNAPMTFTAGFPPDLRTFLTAARAPNGAIVAEPASPPGALITMAQLIDG